VSGAVLDARHLDSGNDTVLFLFNHGKETASADVLLTLPAGNHEATDLVTVQRVAVSRTASGVQLKATLEPGSVQVLRLTRKP
jgi:Beta-galactosidase C-terminal domain